MVRIIAIIGSLLLALFAGKVTASGNGTQQRCEDRVTVLRYLSHQYAEKPVAMGLARNGGLIEVLTSHDGGTFTIIVTSPDGRTCMVAAGEAWQPLAGQLAPPHS